MPGGEWRGRAQGQHAVVDFADISEILRQAVEQLLGWRASVQGSRFDPAAARQSIEGGGRLGKRMALEAVTRRKLASKGDKVIVTAGVPFDVPGSTNTLKVETV